MSRRGSTPEPRSVKRRHSLVSDDESAEKRSRGAEDDKSPSSNSNSLSEGSMAAGPSRNASASSSHRSYAAAEGPSEPRRTRNPSPPSPDSSTASSAGGGGDDGDHSRAPLSASAPGSLRRPASASGVIRRPSWQTMPRTYRPESERPESRSWDRRGSNDPRDAHDHHEPLMTPRHVSLNLTPPTNYLSSSSSLAQPPARTQAAFVGKLYSMLEDEKITSSRLLFWSEDGTSFVCPNPTEFSKDVLPNYFKHNNWQSFVRQLNMYSFNKVSDLYSTANSDPQAWEFRHPLFRRGEPNLLSSIKRKSTRPSNPEGNNAAATSPNDEDVRAAGGWSRDGGHPGPSTTPQARYGSPPREYPATRQFSAYTHPVPVTGPYEGPSSRVHFGAGSAAASSSAGPSSYPRDPRDVREPAPSAEPAYFGTQSIASRQPSIEALSRQVVSLQETINRLHNSLHDERLQNSRTSIEFTNHLLHMADLFTESGRDTRGFKEVLHQQATLFRHRYDQLRATEPSPSTIPEEGRPLSGYGASSLPRSLHEDRRLTSSNRPSPPVASRPDMSRPATSEAGAYYPSLERQQYPPQPLRGGAPQPYHRGGPPRLDQREVPRDYNPGRPGPSSRRENDGLSHEETRGQVDHDPPKTSLRNLIH